MADGTGLIQRFFRDVIEGGRLDIIDGMVAEDFLDHESMPGQPPGMEGARFFANTVRTAFPDIRVTALEPALSDGNLEAAYVILAGTHRGELMGVGPTGRSVEFGSTHIIRIRDGKVAEHWGTTDLLGILQQVGAAPGQG